MALMVGTIMALIQADKGQFSGTLKSADAERSGFVARSKKDKAVIDGDSKPFEQATKKVISSAGSMRDKVGDFAKEMRGELLKVGAATGIIEGFRSIVMAASDLNESANAINVTFSGAQQKVLDFTATASKTIGQSDTQARNAAATFGVYGKQAGLAAEQNAAFSISLVKLASDMASFRNTTPDEAIEAIGAALRGESDPIEKYGVLLTETVLQQRALKMGVIETTSQALTPQQRVLVAYQEILSQTKDAQGDFSRTSGELANQLRTLKAVVVDKAAALGQQLLPAAKQVVSFFTGSVGPAFDVVGNVLKVAVGAVGGLASAFGSLPGPLQVAALTMVAWRLVQGQVTEGASGLRDKLSGLGGTVREQVSAWSQAPTMFGDWARGQAAVAAGLGGLNGELTGTQRAVVGTGDAIARMSGVAAGAAKAGLSSLVSFLGGPWGVALGLAGVAISMWISRQQAAAKAAAEHAAKVKTLTQDIQANGGAVSAQTKAQQVQEGTAKHLYEIASKLGVGQETMTKAILGNRDAIAEVNAAYDRWGIKAGEFKDDGTAGYWERLRRQFEGFAGSKDWGTLAGALTQSRGDFGELSGQMIEAGDAAADTTGKLGEVGVTVGDLAPKAAEVKAALTPMQEALQKLADQSVSDADKVSALKQALDDFAGKKHTVEEAIQAVNDSLRDMGQAFKDAKDDAKKHHESLLLDSGAIDTVTEKGSALQDKIMTLSDAYRQQFAATEQAAISAGKKLPDALVAAAQATAETRQRLIDTATAAGLTADQAQKLADIYDLIPDNVATQITQPGMMEGIINALGLGNNVRNIPNQWQIEMNSTAPEQIALMESLGFKVEHLPNGDILVAVDDDQAKRDLDALTQTDYKTIVVNLRASGLPNAQKLAKEATTQASGGVLEYYAAGGFRPMSAAMAAIVGSYRRTGVQRVIGDNPTVDEAFVPLDPYSVRSQAILDEVLQRMRPEWFRSGGSTPMASGGMGSAGDWSGTPSSAGPSQVDRSITVYGHSSDDIVRKLKDAEHERQVLYGA